MLELWNATRRELRNQLGPELYDTHFSRIELKRGAGGHMALATDDEMVALVVDKNYRTLVERCASALSGELISVTIEFDAGVAPESASVVEPEPIVDSLLQLSLFESASASSTGSQTSPSPASALRPVEAVARTPHRAAARGVRSASVSPTRISRAQGAPSVSLDDRIGECGLSRRFDFPSFVVGKGNEFAFEATRAVVDHLGQLYNPLLIYGGVGLGKTHLMNAVGLASLKNNPRCRVRYLSAETFVNELIDSIGSRSMDRFRQRNRADVDILLIDDIQFIAGKERTQEEFFHTFNALFQAGRQIVLTSDRMPQEVPDLEERLVSRLSMGLITDIQPPDLETRIAILRRKAAALGFEVPAEVLVYLAETIRSNVRELHGALLRIGSFARHTRQPISLEVAQSQLARIANERAGQLRPDVILRATCEHFGVRARDIRGRRRTARIALPRKVTMYLAKRWTHASYPELGRFFDRDHSTVLHACKSVAGDLKKNSKMRGHVEAIERKLGVI